MAVAAAFLGRSIAQAIRDHAESLAGFWATPGSDAKYIPLDEVLAQMHLEDPLKLNTEDLVLESELNGLGL